jgi:SAM-dependent methyltransferase
VARAQSHRSDPRILSHRTLARDHRRLAAMLRPGMSVLDVGCGTGSITADIARAVGPHGRVLGLDRDDSLLAIARQEHAAIPNLRFVTSDILTFTADDRFDIVTAARALQWVSSPDAAIGRMCDAATPGGRIVVLDYNHEDNSWDPEPPIEFRRFYDAFLQWRHANGWDNRMADNLPALFRSQRIEDIVVHVDDEIARRGDPQFDTAGALWTHVVETLGPSLVAAGVLSEEARFTAELVYRDWVRDKLMTQVLHMRTVEGRVR